MKKIYKTPFTEKVILRGENICNPPGPGGNDGPEIIPSSGGGPTPAPARMSAIRLYK